MVTVSVMIRETSGKPITYPVNFDYNPTVRQALRGFVKMWPSKAFDCLRIDKIYEGCQEVSLRTKGHLHNYSSLHLVLR